MPHIDHVNIVVTDMEKSVRFYTDILGLKRGFEVMLEGEWVEALTRLTGARARCVFLEAGNGACRIELLQYMTSGGQIIQLNSVSSTVGLRHVAFTVEDLDGLVKRLLAEDVQLLSEPVTVPFAVGSMGRKRLCYFLDPDGTILEAAAYG